ncbi:MAG: DUF420 domain-containing protein [Planctomycetota bacterium]|jgi:uncharacterized membrane protein YozB (DUF420 family)|nr:DUF420 domain-containing protein [Planctomycetota bacterium]MDP6941282.1 DUF420 domain-containing protein [Planctomycetota bacterium]
MNLPALNATLNGIAGLFLVSGFIAIRAGNEKLHKSLMLSAFLSSIAFLCSYLLHHLTGPELSVKYAGPDWGKIPYLVMLLAHTVLAAAVPFLAMRTIFLGFKGPQEKHRKLARITFPIWVFVSITGVLIYFILYQWTPSWAQALSQLPSS